MKIVKATTFITAALLAAGSNAAAQDTPSPSPMTYLRPVTFPVLAPVPRIQVEEPAVQQAAVQSPQAQPPDAQPPQVLPPASAAASLDRRDDIRLLELVLTQAVKTGADKLAIQMRASEPGSLFVTDTGRTRGFDLQGYGVFFDIDVPMMKQSVLYVTRQLSQQDMRAQLENTIPTLQPGPLRDFAIRELQRMQQQGMRQPGASATQIAQPGVVTGQVADGPAMDPNQLYTEAVKSSVIDAMLKYSVGLKLGADEWLTVAARDAQGPTTPGQVDDASTIVIRIKGSDLTAFHTGKLSPEEVRKRVEVKEL